jgi:uncharacterized glyoxalase superfamily protein PhnB
MTDTHDHDHDHDHEHSHDQGLGHAHPHHHAHPESDPNRVEFIGGRSILNVANVADSLRHYRDVLGFKVSWAWTEQAGFAATSAPPTVAEVMRGHVVIMLAQQEQGGPGTWLYLDLESAAEVDQLHAEYAAAGARIVEPPSDRPWGVREMRVHDLDGHTFRIGGPLRYEPA